MTVNTYTLPMLQARGLLVPDRAMVLNALAPVGDRCPSCRQYRLSTDFVYLVDDSLGLAECCCGHCLMQTDAGQGLGAFEALEMSRRYVEGFMVACVPGEWIIKPGKRRDILARDWVTLGVADVIGKYWGQGCTGSWGREVTPRGGFLDSRRECKVNRVRGLYWTRNGLVCRRCIRSRSKDWRDSKQLPFELRQRQRLICEAWRFAVCVCSLERYVPSIVLDAECPWAMLWRDWVCGGFDTTARWERNWLVDHVRYEYS